MSRSPVTAVLPVKEFAHAKTRLALPESDRIRLALAFAQDALEALLGADQVDRVVIVSANDREGEVLRDVDPDRIRLVADSGSGLRGAVRRGVLAAHADLPGTTVCVVPADLPCLRPADIDRVLAGALPHRGAFVPDRSGTGTTLLVLPAEHGVTVCYRPDSAARHCAAGLVPLPDVPRRARQDVDTLADLLLALRLGLGRESALICEALGLDRYGRREAG